MAQDIVWAHITLSQPILFSIILVFCTTDMEQNTRWTCKNIGSIYFLLTTDCDSDFYIHYRISILPLLQWVMNYENNVVERKDWQPHIFTKLGVQLTAVRIVHVNPWFYTKSVVWNLGLMWKIPIPDFNIKGSCASHTNCWGLSAHQQCFSAYQNIFTHSKNSNKSIYGEFHYEQL